MFFVEILVEIKSLSNKKIPSFLEWLDINLMGFFFSTFLFVNVTMIMLQHTK